MKHFILTLLMVSMLPTQVSAQEMDFMKRMRSTRNREYHKDGNREKYRALWNGYGAVISSIPLWQNEGFQKELNFSPEQLSQLDFLFSKGGSMGHWYQTKAQTDPVLAQMLAENLPLNEELRNDPYGEITPPDVVRTYLDQLRNLTAYYFAESQKDVERILTPEQMQKVRESELALMSEIPILNPSMFECLDMSEEQRQQMEAIKKKLEPEFEKIAEELVEIEDVLGEAKFDTWEKVGIKFDQNGRPVDENGKSLRDDPEAMKRKMDLVDKELEKNVDLQARMKRINERASGFMGEFKFKMFDVLTDAQLEKMQQIIEHPTEYVKKIRDRMQRERAEKEKSAGEKEKWQPGPNSWRPGDPLPKEYLEQRPKRRGFPRAELE